MLLTARTRILFFLAIASTAIPAQAQTTIHVDDDASIGGDGLTWNTAYKFLQDGLFAAAGNPTITEIRVAGGVYKPDQDEAGSVTPGIRTETFQLLNNVELKGGYAGIGAPDPDVRNVDSNASILSGDLSGDDVGELDDPSRNENCYHVVTGSGTDVSALLDGLTVTAGYADGGTPHDSGGGVYIDLGSPSIVSCKITDNAAFGLGSV